ncbi:UNVERIFIED_CONTAM: hypothetical protein K2H54_039825 [Gekko kuhli]
MKPGEGVCSQALKGKGETGCVRDRMRWVMHKRELYERRLGVGEKSEGHPRPKHGQWGFAYNTSHRSCAEAEVEEGKKETREALSVLRAQKKKARRGVYSPSVFLPPFSFGMQAGLTTVLFLPVNHSDS